jgi:two-component system LytT family response regulator
MSRPVRALLVDDEVPGRTNLRLALKDHAGWEVAEECASVDIARMALRRDSRIDVIFLDIQMPAESGMVLARELSKSYAPPVIVFVTAYQHYAVQAFEFHAIDYLLKPFDDERFAAMVARVESLLGLRHRGDYYGEALRRYLDDAERNNSPGRTSFPAHFCVRSVGHIESIAVDEIEWIQSSGNYVELHLQRRTVLHRTTLSELLKRIDPEVFVRVHRRTIVRRAACRALRVVGDGSYQLTLYSGDVAAVSEKYVTEVRAAIGA